MVIARGEEGCVRQVISCVDLDRMCIQCPSPTNMLNVSRLFGSIRSVPAILLP